MDSSLTPVSQHSLTHPVTSPPAHDLAAAFLLGYSDSTRSAYSRDLADWFTFCADHDLDPLTASRSHVDAYARQMAEMEDRSPPPSPGA